MKNLSLTLGLWVLGAAMCAAEPIELNLSSPEGTHKVKFYLRENRLPEPMCFAMR